MNTNTWTRFIKRIPINSNIEKIYKAWATQAGLESWFLRKAEFTYAEENLRDKNEFVESGDKFEWMWYGWSDDVVEKGKIIEANGKDFIKFTFGKAGIVNVQIKTEENETIVELTQEEIPVDEESKFNFYVGCGEGWTFYLANLKSILEGGIDLRNKNIKLTRVINS